MNATALNKQQPEGSPEPESQPWADSLASSWRAAPSKLQGIAQSVMFPADIPIAIKTSGGKPKSA